MFTLSLIRDVAYNLWLVRCFHYTSCHSVFVLGRLYKPNRKIKQQRFAPQKFKMLSHSKSSQQRTIFGLVTLFSGHHHSAMQHTTNLNRLTHNFCLHHFFFFVRTQTYTTLLQILASLFFFLEHSLFAVFFHRKCFSVVPSRD